MIQNRKAKGSRTERKTIELLKSQGYRCMKSGASLGVWDIIGIGELDIVLVQVKSNFWPNTEEMGKLKAFLAPSNCRKLVHRWKDRAEEPDIRVL